MPDGGFQLYSKSLLPLYLFVCILFLTGVVFGGLLVNALTPQQKADVAQYMQSYLAEAAADGAADAAEMNAGASGLTPPAAERAGADGASGVWDAFGMHARWIFLIWLMGLSVIGVPIILLLDFLKGVLVGFTVGYLAGHWSWNGVLFALISVIPQNLVVVPVLIVASVAAISFSAALARSRFGRRGPAVRAPLIEFTAAAVLLTALLFAAALFETFVSPRLMAWAAPIVPGGV